MPLHPFLDAAGFGDGEGDSEGFAAVSGWAAVWAGFLVGGLIVSVGWAILLLRMVADMQDAAAGVPVRKGSLHDTGEECELCDEIRVAYWGAGWE